MTILFIVVVTLYVLFVIDIWAAFRKKAKPIQSIISMKEFHEGVKYGIAEKEVNTFVKLYGTRKRTYD